MTKLGWLICVAALPLGGCGGFLNPPQSVGDVNAGFRYVAIDPLPVTFGSFSGCTSRSGGTPDLLDAIHDTAARVATEEITGEASASSPVINIGGSGRSYRVTQDFIFYDQAPLRFEVPRGTSQKGGATGTGEVRLLGESGTAPAGSEVVTVPVYVGVGVRTTANLTVYEGKVNLADLGTISAAAKAGRVRGSLVTQLLGLKGAKVSAHVPMPGELNPTTIQNATVAVGAIKALIYASHSSYHNDRQTKPLLHPDRTLSHRP